MTENEILFWTQTVSISIDISILYTSDIKELVNMYENNPFYNLLSEEYNYKDFMKKYIKYSEEQVIYIIDTPLKIYYVVIFLNKENNKSIIIGPFIEEAINEDTIKDPKLISNLNDTTLIELKKYYATLPIVDRGKILTITSLFLENYYKTKGPFPITLIGNDDIKKNELNLEKDLENDVPLKIIEERYKRENEFIEAVSNGDFPNAYMAYEKMMSNLYTYYKFRDRITVQRGLSVQITLLRKAAEAGGVHPLHLENLSTKYTLASISKFKLDEGIIVKMIKDYCALVKEHSLKDVSPLMRDAINYIQFNLNSDLTVSSIADYLCITPNYLYRIFKKEYGISVIDYINKKRIKESIKLMKKTDLQIQAIAEKVGINDISYFSRLFKKEIGKSPTQYKKDIGKK